MNDADEIEFNEREAFTPEKVKKINVYITHIRVRGLKILDNQRDHNLNNQVR